MGIIKRIKSYFKKKENLDYDNEYETDPDCLTNMIIPYIIHGKYYKNRLINVSLGKQLLKTKTNKDGNWIIDLANAEFGYKGYKTVIVNGKRFWLNKDSGGTQINILEVE